MKKRPTTSLRSMQNYEILLQTEKSELRVYRNFIAPELYWERAKNLPLVEKPEIRIYGKVCRQRRNVGFFAEEGTEGYKYSGQQTTVVDIHEHEWLWDVLCSVNDALGSEYNGVLVNMYENGEDYISAHADDETGLDAVGVASVCVGATRTFRIRDKKTKEIIIDVPHQPGDLLVMNGKFQQEFLHEIPQQKKIKEPRVSLTFRKHNTSL